MYDSTVDDDGMAGPRTSLAWRRTALACVVAALASLRFALSCHGGSVAEVLTIVLALAATALAIVVAAQAGTSERLGPADTRDGRFKLLIALLIVALVAAHLLGTVDGCR
ncbi:DUF202 domain-containing protein [Mycolicibacterium wolinskyi]|nr:DUF202 domain-containing protein [Mycolicibacterium wolinskyi]MCV7292186.1 DUF202 domain-containing protein [Mycolicibacterium goodii]